MASLRGAIPLSALHSDFELMPVPDRDPEELLEWRMVTSRDPGRAKNLPRTPVPAMEWC